MMGPAAQVEEPFRLGLRLVVAANTAVPRPQKRAHTQLWRHAVKKLMRRAISRVGRGCRSVEHLARPEARLSPQAARRRKLQVGKQARRFKARSVRGFLDDTKPPLHHAVQLRRVGGRELLPNAAFRAQLLKRPAGKLAAVVGANTLDNGRYTVRTNVRKKSLERGGGVGLLPQEIRPAVPRIIVLDQHDIQRTTNRLHRPRSRQVDENTLQWAYRTRGSGLRHWLPFPLRHRTPRTRSQLARQCHT